MANEWFLYILYYFFLLLCSPSRFQSNRRRLRNVENISFVLYLDRISSTRSTRSPISNAWFSILIFSINITAAKCTLLHSRMDVCVFVYKTELRIGESWARFMHSTRSSLGIYILFFRRFSLHFFFFQFFLDRFKRCSRLVSVECFSNLIIYCQRSLCGCLWVKTAIINEKSPWSIVIQFFSLSYRSISTILQLNIVPNTSSPRQPNPHSLMRSQFSMCTHKNPFTYNLSTEIRTKWRLFSLLMKFIIYDFSCCLLDPKLSSMRSMRQISFVSNAMIWQSISRRNGTVFDFASYEL